MKTNQNQKDYKLEQEFAYHKYRTQLIQECQGHLDQISAQLETVSDSQTLRILALNFSRQYFESCIEIYEYNILVNLAAKKLTHSLKVVDFLFFLLLLSNFFTAIVVWQIVR